MRIVAHAATKHNRAAGLLSQLLVWLIDWLALSHVMQAAAGKCSARHFKRPCAQLPVKQGTQCLVAIRQNISHGQALECCFI